MQKASNNKEKFQFKCSEASFIGHGLKVDPKKVEAIAKVEQPVHGFIGLAKYLSKFLQGLSEMCKQLHHLMHKDAD